MEAHHLPPFVDFVDFKYGGKNDGDDDVAGGGSGGLLAPISIHTEQHRSTSFEIVLPCYAQRT